MHEYISITMSTTMKISNEDADDDYYDDNGDYDNEDYNHVEDRRINHDIIIYFIGNIISHLFQYLTYTYSTLEILSILITLLL